MQTVEVHHAIQMLDPNEWDALCGDRPFTQQRWLRLAETVLAEHTPRYLLVRRDGQLVAAAVGTLEHQVRNPTLNAKAGGLLRHFPCLRIAMPLTATSGLLVRETSNYADDLDALLQALHTFVKRTRVSFYTIDHLPAQHLAQVSAAQRHYQPIAMLPETCLEIMENSFDRYLATLPGKKRRELGRMARHAEQEGIVVQRLTPAAEQSPLLDRLVANLLQRYAEPNRFAPDLFLKAAAVLGDDLTVLAAYRDGHIVGCMALLRSGDDLSAKWLGRNYARTEETMVYHALLEGGVKEAIALGVRRLHFGAAAYEAKRHFGVTLDARSELLATRSHALNWCIGKARQWSNRQTNETAKAQTEREETGYGNPASHPC